MKNHTIIEGLISRSFPELRHTKQSGNPYTRFSIIHKADETKEGRIGDYFDVQVWGSLAEEVHKKSLSEGQRVIVEGKLKKWKTKEGQYRTDINADKIEFVSNRDVTQKPYMEEDPLEVHDD